MYKRKYVIIEFPNASYVLHHCDEFYHLFDPYPCLPSGKPDADENGYACWTKFSSLEGAKRRLIQNVIIGAESCTIYTFEITSVRKAPRKLIISQRLAETKEAKVKKPEDLKTLHEKEEWLKQEPTMWSRIKSTTIAGKERKGSCDSMWNNWEIEVKRDLYSIVGELHQTSSRFSNVTRGKFFYKLN